MRDDFDAVVADRCKVLDDVPVLDTWARVLDRVAVPDTWSRMTMIDLETPVPAGPRRKGPTRVLVAGLLAAAAVVAIALVVTRNDDAAPADQLGPTATVSPTTPPPIAWPDHGRTRALFGTPDEQLAPGTYFLDEVDGTPTPRIFVTIGTGWSNFLDGEGLGKVGPTPTTQSPDDDVGFITFGRPDRVYVDACHWHDGFHAGPVTTLDDLVIALKDQGGWADVTAPSDISVGGHPGKTFQRTTPAVLSDCSPMAGGMRTPEQTNGRRFRSWKNENDSNFGGSYYEAGQLETLLVVDIDGTVVVINANVWAGSSAADRAEFAAVLASIRIDRE